MAYFKELPQQLPEGTEKNQETIRIAGVPAEIGTESLPNTSLKRYHCTSIYFRTLLAVIYVKIVVI
jgi:hypothetical protein